MSEDEARREDDVEAHHRHLKANDEGQMEDETEVEAHHRTVKATDEGESADDDFEAHRAAKVNRPGHVQ